MNPRILRTNVIGLARSFIAFSTFLSLALNNPHELFAPFGERLPYWSTQISLFQLVHNLDLARAIACLLLVPVIVGYRPRYTAVLHWYVAFSFAKSAYIAEGGDQLASIIALLLIPILLFDSRKWHWSSLDAVSEASGDWRDPIVTSTLQIIRIQMCVVYLQASVGKMIKPEWAKGTAIYYWIQHPIFGPPEALQSTMLALLQYPILSFIAVWGVMLLELTLAAGLVIDRKYRPLLLLAGIAFHIGIYVVHGLGTFGLVMIGALILYLRDPMFAFELNILALRPFLTRLPSISKSTS